MNFTSVMGRFTTKRRNITTTG